MRFFIFLFLASCSSITVSKQLLVLSCKDDSEKQLLRSKELQEIVKSDQTDRRGDINSIDWREIAPRDEARRKRIGEIFGEGCIGSSADYAAAALVYQHGNRPDHFFQTFLWAKKSSELGDATQIEVMAMGIDRYLVNSGHRQLFATQATKLGTDVCWCLQKVESSFPDRQRVHFAKANLKQRIKWVETLNADQPSCKFTKICDQELKESPKGTVPGFW